MKTVAAIAALTIALAITAAAQAQSGGSIRFVVTGLESEEGHLLCALYENEAAWLGEERLQVTRATVRDGQAVCVFDDVPAGSYAISAFHDEDDDRVLDRGAFGIPTEDYCVSRDARRPLGAPRYRDARFEYRGGVVRLSARAR